MWDVRTCRRGRADSGGKGAYPGRNAEECRKGKNDLGHEQVGIVEGERTEGQSRVYSEEACLAVEVWVDVDSRRDLQGEGRNRSGRGLICGLEGQEMQDWNVCLKISGAGGLI